MRTLEFAKAILFRPEGSEVGVDNPGEATRDDPLILIMRRARGGHRPKGDGDLPGGEVRLPYLGETIEGGLWREIEQETGLGPDKVHRPRLVWANTILDVRDGNYVSVTHNIFAAQVDLGADVDPDVFSASDAEHGSRQWMLLSRSVGATGTAPCTVVPSYVQALNWVRENGLLVPSA